MTTWFNTFSIICYLNFYLRTLNLPEDEFGFIKNTDEFAIFVSGDDQLIFCNGDIYPQVIALIHEYLDPDRKNVHLGRKADPIHSTFQGIYSFVSRIFQNFSDGAAHCREPQKLLMRGQFYSGMSRALTRNPAEHAYLTGLSLSESLNGSVLFSEVAKSRLRMGKQNCNAQ